MRQLPLKNILAERIIAEAELHRMFPVERHPRNHALLRLIYLGGLRISEVCGLRWRDLQAREEAGQVTVFGKGDRRMLLPTPLWRELVTLRGEAGPDDPVFRSQKRRGHLDPAQVHRLVKAAAARTGMPAAVSAHRLWHARASHALDRGAPIDLVQAAVGNQRGHDGPVSAICGR